METIFDKAPDRHNTASVKYALKGKAPDLLPLWVADMDFPAPPAVLDALKQLNQHGIYGYPDWEVDYEQAVCAWYHHNFSWDPLPQWNIRGSGVVTSLALALRVLCRKNDAVLIQPPVYPPFREIIIANQRRIVYSPLVQQAGIYNIDFSDLEKQIMTHKVKVMILCSPHNPLGRIWTKAELTKLGELCLKHGVYVISDEIHADIVYSPFCHPVFAGLDPALAEITVTATAPSKTFNIAGLQVSNTFISNPKIRADYQTETHKFAYHGPSIAGLTAAYAAYLHGQDWRDQLVDYLQNNRAFLQDELKMTKIKVNTPQATYLAWLDCRQLGLDDKQLNEFFLDQAKLWLNPGLSFGDGGSGFMRLNFGCPLATLKLATERLKQALSRLS